MIDENAAPAAPTPDETAPAEESRPEDAPVAPAPPPAEQLLEAAAEAHEARVAPEALGEPQPSEPPAEVAEQLVATDADETPGATAEADPVSDAEPETEPESDAEPEPVAESPAAQELESEAAPELTPTAETESAAPKPKKPRKAKTAGAGDVDAADEVTAPAVEEAPVAAGVAAEGTEAAAAEGPPESKKRWYAVKVQSGREESIKAAIERKVKIEGLEPVFGQIVIPVEEINEKKKVKVKNKKTGETTTQERNVVKKVKKFHGYIFAEVEFNDEILYVFRETSGVGDFVGIPATKRGSTGERPPPTPMTEDEVKSMLTGVSSGKKSGKSGKTVVKLDFEKGDKVRIRNGPFANHEAEVKSITEAKDPTDSPKVTVIVTMWGRPVDVELDYWEVDKA